MKILYVLVNWLTILFTIYRFMLVNTLLLWTSFVLVSGLERWVTIYDRRKEQKVTSSVIFLPLHFSNAYLNPNKCEFWQLSRLVWLQMWRLHYFFSRKCSLYFCLVILRLKHIMCLGYFTKRGSYGCCPGWTWKHVCFSHFRYVLSTVTHGNHQKFSFPGLYLTAVIQFLIIVY